MVPWNELTDVSRPHHIAASGHVFIIAAAIDAEYIILDLTTSSMDLHILVIALSTCGPLFYFYKIYPK